MKLNLSQKLISLIIVVCIFFVGVEAYTNFTGQKDLYRRTYVDKARSIAYGLDANIKSREDLKLENLLPVIQKNIWLYSDILKIKVSKAEDQKLITIASNVAAEIGAVPDADNWKSYSEDTIIDKTVSGPSQDILRVYSPIHISGKTIGSYQIDLNLESVNKQINQQLLATGLIYGLLLILTISIFIFVLNILLIKPLNTLISGLREISRGNMDHLIQVKTGDEYEEAAAVFNTMVQDIKNYHQELLARKDDLEKEVKERTNELEMSKTELEQKLKELGQMNNLMIGRELKMMELKKEIDRLTKKV